MDARAPEDPRLAALMEELRGPVESFTRGLLAERDAADAASETLLVVLKRVRRGFLPRNWHAFALGVAWRKCCEHKRRARRREDPLPEFSQHDGAGEGRKELEEWVNAGLRRLLPEERAILHLRFEEDLSYRKIARILGLPLGSISGRIVLRRVLSGRYFAVVEQEAAGFTHTALMRTDPFEVAPPGPVEMAIPLKIH